MKTIVSGGAGMIGSHLVKRLLDEGREVVLADDFSRGTAQNLVDKDIKPSDLGLSHWDNRLDLRYYEDALKVVKGAEVIFHLAAKVGGVQSLHGSNEVELDALISNVAIDANVFRACYEAGVKKIIYASSVSVYPIHTQYQPNVVLFEDDLDISTWDLGSRIVNPEGGYGWAKLLGEVALSYTTGPKVGIVRIFSVYGEGEDFRETSHVVPALIRKAIRYPEEDFRVWGDGSQSRDFLYVADCIDAFLKLEATLSKDSIKAITLNIGAGKPVSVRTIAEKVVSISGKKINIVYEPSKPVGPLSRAADTTKAKSLLDWQPRFSLDDGLRRTYQWVLQKLQHEGEVIA
jgi:nucleoside-diphosphate-sugar epimerase